MSKYDYILTLRESARHAHEEAVKEFGETNELLKDLRIVFDWLAEERDSTRVSSRKFKQRLPDVHKKFPLLASCFSRMDVNGDCWLDWSEFVSFCLQDERMRHLMKRQTRMNVYGVDFSGALTLKDYQDPIHGCECSLAPPLLPWETMHVVEWRITGLQYSGFDKGAPVMHNGRAIDPGTFITSPPFRAAGVKGFLTFWPAGYWTACNKRKKKAVINFLVDKEEPGAPCPIPPPSTWCCVGCKVPPGSNLQLRYYVGRQKSKVRECYWGMASEADSLWAPDGERPPEEVIQIKDEDYLTVGVQIFRNKGVVHGRPGVIKVPEGARFHVRPKVVPQGVPAPKTSKILNRNLNVMVAPQPALTQASSMPSFAQRTKSLLHSASASALHTSKLI
mmetsp:Transcript_64218/g.150769  ORF Transcript_64218/g.150769 Transcript_64218/m.150769 type:complete len:391 (+) Transcript_64218:70-1242(+)